jgi:hypothetical protein
MGPWLDVLELIALRGFLANFYFEADRPAKVYRISVVKQLTVPTSMVHAVVFFNFGTFCVDHPYSCPTRTFNSVTAGTADAVDQYVLHGQPCWQIQEIVQTG